MYRYRKSSRTQNDQMTRLGNRNKMGIRHPIKMYYCTCRFYVDSNKCSVLICPLTVCVGIVCLMNPSEVTMDTIEVCKENWAPVRTGRDVTSLKSIASYSTKPNEFHLRLVQEHAYVLLWIG